MKIKLNEDWEIKLNELWEAPFWKNIVFQYDSAMANGKIIYPAEDQIFNAFNFTPFNQIKVVIVGQDPYHGPNQANGLCFSVAANAPIPPSLRNIYKELKNNYPNYNMPTHGYLEYWAKQGILLLNSSLTVEKGLPASHNSWQWDLFTSFILEMIAKETKNTVFILWGANAKKKAKLVAINNHLVLQAGHPSFANVHGQFFGNQHFLACNNYLIASNKEPINWQLP
jgi:uracil-DNA glycosylase